MLNKLIDKILLIRDIIFKRPNLDNGFIYKKPEEYDYLHDPNTFGFVKKIVLILNGNSKKYRSEPEIQKPKGKRDRLNCVSNANVNCQEHTLNIFNFVLENKELQKNFNADELWEIGQIIKIFKHFGFYNKSTKKFEVSKRYPSKTSGTTARGNTLKKVADAVRKYGLVPENVYPAVNNYNEYYQKIPEHIEKLGKELCKYVEFNYEWVNPIHFHNSRIFGALQTSGYAWGSADSNGRYLPTSLRKNHSFITDNGEKNKYHGLEDTYIPFDKKATWNYNFGWGMLHTIHLIKPLRNKYEELLDSGKRYLILPEKNGEFHQITPDGLVYIKDREEIKKIISKETSLNLDLKELTEQKKLMWVNNEYFIKLNS